MNESYRLSEMNKANKKAKEAKEAKDWDMYEFWMNKATFLYAIGQQSS